MNRFFKCFLLLCVSTEIFSQVIVKSKVNENLTDFENLIKNAKSTNRNDYINFINKRLENNDEKFIYAITDFIKEDSLIECIPNLKKFISNCNRQNSNTESTLTCLSKIGSEKDKEFVLNDFKKNINKKHISFGWLEAYISSIERLNISNAHNLLNDAFFDWNGINLNFAKYKILFDIKNELEKSYFNNFPKTLIDEGYKLKNVLVFIDNSLQVVNGDKPKTRYLIKIELPYNSSYPISKNNEIEEKSLSKIQEFLNLPKDNINLEYNDGGFYLKQQERFSASTLTVNYIDYLIKYPNSECSNFIIELNKLNYFKDYDKYYVNKFISNLK